MFFILQPDSDEEAEVEDYDQSFTSSANRTATQNDIEAIPTQITVKSVKIITTQFLSFRLHAACE